MTEAQKHRLANRCREMMQRFAGGDTNAVHNMVTGDESWIYCYDPETKRQSAQWMFPFEELATEVKRGRSVGKNVVASFFGMTGHYATFPLEGKKILMAKNSYCFGKFSRKRPRSRIFLHHHYTSPHTARQITNYLGTSSIKILAHPPYSPDLVPCDFYLFRKKKPLRKVIYGR
ncbi:Mariner Mos1 transposase [Eumeta japonica]|uniref:Mariner Mos1 transposase n=1 Tax=Eumeta variegata TaxID=151549 RepID=A0A4C1XBJ5_EUMVA|nr:Mariner Mos1 transposase [Eumeta japonica]